MNINLKGDLLSLKTPVVMGVLNFTEDSFYAESRCASDLLVVRRAEQILQEGAAIIDVGAVSTRPGSNPIDANTEYLRVKKCLKLILQNFPNAKISVDTFRANIAQMSIDEGAVLINDISGGEDPQMFPVVAKYQIPYCLTFNMRNFQLSKDEIFPEMLSFFGKKVEQLRQMGLNDIVLDPGFGFGQTVEESLYLMNHIEILESLELPTLIGISRKRMVFNTLGVTPQEALAGTIVLNTVALQKGAHILRVHDVKEAVDAVKMVEALKQNI